MPTLEYNNAVDAPVAEELFQRWLSKITSTITDLGEKSVSLALVDQETIKSANLQYRGKDAVTDVLSFAEQETEEMVNSQTFGEILICYDKAVQQAEEFGVSVEQELELLFVHGFLHLIGHTHEETKDTEAMKALENEILSAHHSRL